MPYVATFPVPGPGDAQRVARHIAAARSDAIDAMLQLDDAMMYTLPHETSVALQGIRHDLQDMRETLRGMYRWVSIQQAATIDAEPRSGAIDA